MKREGRNARIVPGLLFVIIVCLAPTGCLAQSSKQNDAALRKKCAQGAHGHQGNRQGRGSAAREGGGRPGRQLRRERREAGLSRRVTASRAPASPTCGSAAAPVRCGRNEWLLARESGSRAGC